LAAHKKLSQVNFEFFLPTYRQIRLKPADFPKPNLSILTDF
jgi:hypothetical protein